MTRKLLDELVVDVCEEHKRRLRIIDNEDYSGVVRKVREFYVAEHGHEPTHDYLDSGVYGLKQYYAVALLDPLNAHSVSAKLDPFWHAHILHTHKYMDFSERVVGRYMHHVPLDPDDVERVENIGVLYGYTIEVLEQLFGEVDEENWATEGVNFRLCCGHASSYEEVNRLGLFPAVERGILVA
ncbi:MAG: hypothetical protein HY005_00640 [Candidatus Staskawiczbacteria bacterium]|nr:hypothetical protein [Candidatus Staskawiczbacteria bacterium]